MKLMNYQRRIIVEDELGYAKRTDEEILVDVRQGCTIVALRRCIIHNTLHSIRMKMIIHQFSKYLFVFINLNNVVRFSNLYFKHNEFPNDSVGEPDYE